MFQAAEIASRLIQKKEMGCKAFEAIHIEQGDSVEAKMMRLLGAKPGTKPDTRSK